MAGIFNSANFILFILINAVGASLPPKVIMISEITVTWCTASGLFVKPGAKLESFLARAKSLAASFVIFVVTTI